MKAARPVSDRKAFLGTVAMGSAQAVKLGLQILLVPILARILGPSAYGVVGFAMPFILFAAVFCDAGLGAALVRHPNPSRELESTVFWLSTGLGGLLALVLCAAAIPLSLVLGEPELAPILAALSAILVISGALSVINSRITRARRFGVFAANELVTNIVAAGAALLAAFNGLGAWSLVVQQLVLWIGKAVWLTPSSGFRPRFICAPRLAAPYLRFGLNSVGANLADLAGRNLPNVIVGALLGVRSLGHFSMAIQLARVPDSVISGPVFLATLTNTSRAQNNGISAAPLMIRTLRMLFVSLVPVYAGMMLVPDLLTHIVLGPDWSDTTPAIAALAPSGLLFCLYATTGSALLGLGRSDHQFRLTALWSAGLAIGAAIGGQFGLTGAAMGVSVGALAVAPFYVGVLSMEIRVSAWALLSGMARPLIAAGVMALAVMVGRAWMVHQPMWIELLMSIGVGVVVYGAALTMLCGRQCLADLQSILDGGAPGSASGMSLSRGAEAP